MTISKECVHHHFRNELLKLVNLILPYRVFDPVLHRDVLTWVAEQERFLREWTEKSSCPRGGYSDASEG